MLSINHIPEPSEERHHGELHLVVAEEARGVKDGRPLVRGSAVAHPEVSVDQRRGDGHAGEEQRQAGHNLRIREGEERGEVDLHRWENRVERRCIRGCRGRREGECVLKPLESRFLHTLASHESRVPFKPIGL